MSNPSGPHPEPSVAAREQQLPPALAAAGNLLAQLIAQGLRDVVLCPGSRSAPVAYAAYRAADRGFIRLHVRIDERTAGFLASGLAKATGTPAVVVTTSGTAVANLHPSVLEASHSSVPLIVLSADRPHELRGTGANQTTTQPGIFGSAARLLIDVPAPAGIASEATDIRAVAVRAWAAATGASAQAGPAHVNLALREPLAPNAQELALLDLIFDDIPSPVITSRPALTGTVGADVEVAAEVARVGKTLVVAGDGSAPVATRVAEAQGWPIISEPTSGIVSSLNVVPAGVNILAHSALGGKPLGRWADLVSEVEQVLVFGHATLTRPVQRLIAAPGVRTVVVPTRVEPWNDASRTAQIVLYGVDPSLFTPEEGTVTQSRAEWLDRWTSAGHDLAEVLARTVGEGDLADGLAPMRTVRSVVAASEPGDALVLGSSSAIRDADAYVTDWPRGLAVYGQRGLAGIDGTLSTALGIAIATGSRTRVVVGDLTFLHDAGALLRTASDPVGPLDIVVLNDRGGAIFSGLEHSGAGDPQLFERVFGTPHTAHLDLLCAAYGIDYQAVRSTQELEMLLREPNSAIRVFEVRFDRDDRGSASTEIARAVGETPVSDQRT
ncbi:2-succinyl-5-enolpyruvyl-6-hydroxy-3-cyclohexene-1-carboxylic-acid synthase [Timonella senegalensis]|uniref:2-succinyl-5-enolpyruvyl-6-hydroxy-3- cyclohexene-1-carboxylic-acid synthase n=1 Tax=Timonella senegalensis TaxID=1465825 RepID=UPI0002D91B06|nr:2-succinyl-5-enolpyruvyl-6-hydroxy-3-cyclohexene-1-carboxylic-acid synthase [Timonella senegalensis]